MIPIYRHEPKDWKDLQNKVAKIFSDMGYNTDVEKDIELVRGKVNVDVYAIKYNLSVREVHIAECKYWTEPIPKSVVHSVRTVLSNYGANSGYIISKNGFQSGAYDAAANSNLYLLSFEEFQLNYRVQWLDKVVDELELLGYPLRKYSDPLENFYDREFEKLSADKQKKFITLTKKHHINSLASFRLHYKNAISGQLELEYIDMVVEKNSKDFPENIKINCLMDYFDYLKDYCRNGVKEFDDIFGKELRKN